MTAIKVLVEIMVSVFLALHCVRKECPHSFCFWTTRWSVSFKNTTQGCFQDFVRNKEDTAH